MKKRPKRTTRASTSEAAAAQAERRRAPVSLQYKVIELSTVDENTLEHTVNEWVGQGWNLEGLQFAMRESSKRPAMAFVFFTRPTDPAERETAPPSARLIPLSAERGRSRPISSAFQRLRELAEDDSASH